MTISSGKGYLVIGDINTGYLRYTEWPQQTVTLSSTNVFYIYVDSTSTVLFSTTKPNTYNNIILYAIRTDGTGVDYVQNIQNSAQYPQIKSDTYLQTAIGPIIVSGLITSTPDNTHLDVSAGSYYYSTNLFSLNYA